MSINHPIDLDDHGINKYKINTIQKNIIHFQQYVKAMRLNETETQMTQEMLLALIMGIAKRNTLDPEARHRLSTRVMEIITKEINR